MTRHWQRAVKVAKVGAVLSTATMVIATALPGRAPAGASPAPHAGGAPATATAHLVPGAQPVLGLRRPYRAFPLTTAKPVPPSWAHPEAALPTTRQQAQAAKSPKESANWSGYVDAGAGARFTEVSGCWSVPTVENITAAGYSSTWVGIDGTTTNDLIQVGTEQDWGTDGDLYYAWYEIVPGSVMYLGEVLPGDQISAEVAHVATASWTITVEDVTRHTVWAGAVSYSAPGNSAEWVEEVPTNDLTKSLFPLADFGAVQFSNLTVGGPGTGTATVSPVYMAAITKGHEIEAYPDQYNSATNSFNVTYGAPSSSPVTFPGVPVATTRPGTSTTTTTTMPATTTTTPSALINGPGYWLAGMDGGVFSFGSARFHGSTLPLWPKASEYVPMTGIAAMPDGHGYWLVNILGGVFAFGDARFFGSLASMDLLGPDTIGIVPTADGKGYFLLNRTGDVFAFGDAHFAGSCATSDSGCGGAEATSLVLDATGSGYWVLLSNCKMIAFGDAPRIPDTDCQRLARAGGTPARAAARTPDGRGYWVLLLNGVVFPEGDAKALGSWISPIATTPRDPTEAIVPTSDGRGAWIVLADGTVAPCGDAPTLGEMMGTKLNAQIFSATGW